MMMVVSVARYNSLETFFWKLDSKLIWVENVQFKSKVLN